MGSDTNMGLMVGFELVVSASPVWISLTRDLIATATTPLDLSVDRLNDLLVLVSTLVSDAAESPESDRFSVVISLEDNSSIAFTLTSYGNPDLSMRPISEMALSKLADEHWSRASDGGSQVGFVFSN